MNLDKENMYFLDEKGDTVRFCYGNKQQDDYHGIMRLLPDDAILVKTSVGEFAYIVFRYILFMEREQGIPLSPVVALEWEGAFYSMTVDSSSYQVHLDDKLVYDYMWYTHAYELERANK